MAGFGAIFAGALKGWGEGRMEEIKAEREARLEELRTQREDRRIAEERDFRSKEAEIGRTAQSSENEKSRQFEAEQNDLTRADKRATEGEFGTTETGETVRIRGDAATPVKGPDGKPVKLAKKDSDSTPAEVSTAEWLIKKGVAKDAADAWSKVRSARENDGQRAKLVLDAYKGMQEDYHDDRSNEEKLLAAQALVDDLTGEKENPAPKGKTSTTVKRDGMSDQQVIDEAKDAIAKGKDPAAVKALLKEMGIDPSAAGL